MQEKTTQECFQILKKLLLEKLPFNGSLVSIEQEKQILIQLIDKVEKEIGTIGID